MDWHPLGHVLCTASNDQTLKVLIKADVFSMVFFFTRPIQFWTRSRPGDLVVDQAAPSSAIFFFQNKGRIFSVSY
jgi:hypothetical protein